MKKMSIKALGLIVMILPLLCGCDAFSEGFPREYSTMNSVDYVKKSAKQLKEKRPSYRIYRYGQEIKDDTLAQNGFFHYDFKVKDGKDSIVFKLKIHENSESENTLYLEAIGKFTPNWLEFHGPNSDKFTDNERKHYVELFENEVLDNLKIDWEEKWFANIFNGLF